MPPSTRTALLGKHPEEDLTPFAYGAFTPCGAPFQGLRLGEDFLTPPHHRSGARMLPRPPTGNACGLSRPSGLGWFPFDRLYSGSRFAFLSSRYLDVSVPWVWPPTPIYSAPDPRALPPGGYPIRKPTDQSLPTAPRGYRCVAASFIACQRQNIHHPPLIA